MLSLSSSRITADWPWLVGMMLTRKSSCLSPTVILIRPSVGPPLFGDVDLGENLDPGDQRGQHPPRRAFTFDANAVNSVADADRSSNGSTWMSLARSWTAS